MNSKKEEVVDLTLSDEDDVYEQGTSRIQFLIATVRRD